MTDFVCDKQRLLEWRAFPFVKDQFFAGKQLSSPPVEHRGSRKHVLHRVVMVICLSDHEVVCLPWIKTSGYSFKVKLRRGLSGDFDGVHF
ncbi:Uncharacterised protein [Burkholderia pseudomallei]|nr:Uncharacterised protein [Burkholderia pseudomallei]